MTLTYNRGDELPAWVPTVIVNGDEAVDFTDGWTFDVTLSSGAVVIAANPEVTPDIGFVTVTWAPGDLNQAPGAYAVQLTMTRVLDQLQMTIEDRLLLRPRGLAEV